MCSMQIRLFLLYIEESLLNCRKLRSGVFLRILAGGRGVVSRASGIEAKDEQLQKEEMKPSKT